MLLYLMANQKKEAGWHRLGCRCRRGHHRRRHRRAHTISILSITSCGGMLAGLACLL